MKKLNNMEKDLDKTPTAYDMEISAEKKIDDRQH